MNKTEYNKINLFLARVNKVTSNHRHGQNISQIALDTLSNSQLEMEQGLEECKPADESLCGYTGGCGSRMNGRCDRLEPCEKYITLNGW